MCITGTEAMTLLAAGSHKLAGNRENGGRYYLCGRGGGVFARSRPCFLLIISRTIVFYQSSLDRAASRSTFLFLRRSNSCRFEFREDEVAYRILCFRGESYNPVELFSARALDGLKIQRGGSRRTSMAEILLGVLPRDENRSLFFFRKICVG